VRAELRDPQAGKHNVPSELCSPINAADSVSSAQCCQDFVSSAAVISSSAALSAALTGTPPIPKNPPSFAASATLLAILSNQPAHPSGW